MNVSLCLVTKPASSRDSSLVKRLYGTLGKPVSHLRNKQHAVGGQGADEDGTGHNAVDHIGPGLKEDGHGKSNSGGDGDQCNYSQNSGRLVDWRVADIAGQPC